MTMATRLNEGAAPGSPWTIDAARGAVDQPQAAIPVIGPDDVVPIVPGHDLWDMWQIARADGSTVIAGGRSWWFFLATPQLDDPEARHDRARIRLTSHGADGWRDHGWVYEPGFTPGSREWSGSAVLEADGETLTMYFTAAGRHGGAPSFEQRLFETRGRFTVDGDTPHLSGWSEPVESFAADDHWYTRADETEAPATGIKGFRDPGFFRDPATGHDYLLFVGTAGWTTEQLNGVIGVAERTATGWSLRAPMVQALGVNSELERPHIVMHAGRYYLFWSTQGRRFAPGLGAPTGLYGMVADRFDGPWRPINGTGLVAANPAAEPFQAYCWWVTGELDVISFVDYWGLGDGVYPTDPDQRRPRFGGTAAPWFRLAIDGDRVTIA
ncbi:glycoside hydrolase family 68 protein [Sphingomonas mollis]|nr:glycoside hydrolase family 68 protein [Sphingomonas sp. BT553]